MTCGALERTGGRAEPPSRRETAALPAWRCSAATFAAVSGAPAGAIPSPASA